MKRRTVLLLSTVLAAPALADAPQPGQGTFASGRGHITFEAGLVEMSVEPVHGDAYIAVDGSPVTFAEGIDSVDGQHYGGTLSYVLPGADEPSWLGRDLRVFGSYQHQSADADELSVAQGPTIFDAFDFTTVSKDGRAFASTFSHAASADVQIGLFSPEPSVGLLCTAVSGSQTSSGFHDAGFGAPVQCGVDITGPHAQMGVSQGESVWVATAHAVETLGDPIDTVQRVASRYAVVVGRGEAGFAGDHRILPTLMLTPSVSVAIAERRADFMTAQTIADDPEDPKLGAMRLVSGRLVSRDAALNVGLRTQYAAGGGVDLFGSLNAAVVRRKTQMVENGISIAAALDGITTAGLLVGGAPDYVRGDTTAAFQGAFELGAAYTFVPTEWSGPLRLSLAGAISYDSDIPTYGNVGAFNGPLSAPIAAAGIAYTGETAMTLKGSITFELP